MSSPDLIDAAQQALEALEQYTAKELTVGQRYTNEGQRLLDTITALRAALAQLQPDPVDEYRKGFIAGQIDMRDREQAEQTKSSEET